MPRPTRAQQVAARRARPVSARTARKRARAHAEEQARKAATGGKPTRPPETIGQARVWERKKKRYEIAGLCEVDACHAAWGHAEGWAILPWNPCEACQPIINAFDTGTPHPKWRKILQKLEYMTVEDLGAWLDAHEPTDEIPPRVRRTRNRRTTR